MKLNEIKINGVYLAVLKVQFRNEKEVQDVELFVRVVGKTSNDNIEVVILNSPDSACYYLEPWQLETIS